MKTTALGFAAAVLLGMASFVAPASASTITPAGITQPSTDISARRVVRKVIRRAPVCTVRKVVTRGPFGRRIVRKTRVCR